MCPHQACRLPTLVVPQDVILKACLSRPRVLLVGCGIFKLEKILKEKSSGPFQGGHTVVGDSSVPVRAECPVCSHWKAHGTLPALCMSIADGLERLLQGPEKGLAELSTLCPGLRVALSCSKVSLFGQ